ncbi:MAG: cyclic nucleotide-binding domain-containing protein [Nitrospiraceae bacterium]|nr:cyclic nucleotide-binding domain-containing protein [Nitrospiraceae bacterium]
MSKINLSREEREYHPGDIVVRQGDKTSFFMYLRKGLLKISREMSDGKNQIISLARPLDFIGLLSVFSERIYQFSITAIEDSALCFIDLDLMKEIVRKDGNFALKLLENMSSVNEIIRIRDKKKLSRIAEFG